MEIYKEKQDQKLVLVYKLIYLKLLRPFHLRLSLERSFKYFGCFPPTVEDAFLTTAGLD